MELQGKKVEVYQIVFTRRSRNQRLICGTVKTDVIGGDAGCPCLVASSVYDSKPVHYLSMVTHELKWVVK
eukprot:5033248-Ditylum_brightwellii.AAC.1